MKFSVVILCFNSQETIVSTIRAIERFSDDIHVVDSYSSDRTYDLAVSTGALVVRHRFVNYSAQRNWAIENLSMKYEWEFHLDADERVSDDLAIDLEKLLANGAPDDVNGFCVPRLVHFLGRP